MSLALEADALERINHGSSCPNLTRLWLDLEYLHQRPHKGSVDSTLMHLYTGQCLQRGCHTMLSYSGYGTARVCCHTMQDCKVPPVMASSAIVN